jgi:hypothetical protein
MLTKQLREMERQSKVVNTKNKTIKKTNYPFMENAYLIMSEWKWNKCKRAYRNWYKKTYGISRKHIITSDDYAQVLAYIKENDLVFPFPNSGKLQIDFASGGNQTIYFNTLPILKK